MTPELAVRCNGFLAWLVPVLLLVWFAGIGLVAWLERND
jgi:hypothetical protein